MKTPHYFLILAGSLAGLLHGLAAGGDFALEIKKAVEVSFQSEQGKFYRLQKSPSVGPPVWTTLGATIQGNGLRQDAGFLTGSNLQAVFRVQEFDLTNGLVLHYPFNGNANDESGHGNDGIITGATLGTNRFGVICNSYAFAATGSYPLWVGDTISTANSNGFPTSTSDLSVSLWASLSLIGPDYHLFFANREGNQFQLGIGVFTGTNAPIEFYSGARFAPDVQTASLGWSLGRWYCIQLTRSANIVTIFRDGVTLAQGNVTTGNEAPPEKLILDFAWRTLPGAGNHPLWGQLDDIRLYNRALSEEEVLAVLNLRE